MCGDRGCGVVEGRGGCILKGGGVLGVLLKEKEVIEIAHTW